MIGTETDACPAVNVVDNVPVKPVPVIVNVAEPAVAPVIGTVTEPVCPAVPFATNVPVTDALPQLKVNVATGVVTVTEGLQLPEPCADVTVNVRLPAAPVPS